MSSIEALRKKRSAKEWIAFGTQPKISGVALCIYRLQILPLALDLDVSFIYLLSIVRRSEMSTDAFVEFRSIGLNPIINGGVLYTQPSLQHHLL